MAIETPGSTAYKRWLSLLSSLSRSVLSSKVYITLHRKASVKAQKPDDRNAKNVDLTAIGNVSLEFP